MRTANEQDALLADLRKKIDALDERILGLLNERAALSVEVGRRKSGAGGGQIYCPEREQQLLQALHDHNNGPLANEDIDTIWNAIMTISRKMQKFA